MVGLITRGEVLRESLSVSDEGGDSWLLKFNRLLHFLRWRKRRTNTKWTVSRNLGNARWGCAMSCIRTEHSARESSISWIIISKPWRWPISDGNGNTERQDINRIRLTKQGPR